MKDKVLGRMIVEVKYYLLDDSFYKIKVIKDKIGIICSEKDIGFKECFVSIQRVLYYLNEFDMNLSFIKSFKVIKNNISDELIKKMKTQLLINEI